jgi:signal transduction histidine kinase
VSDATFPPQQAVAGHNGRYVQISREEEAQLNASDQGAANLRLLAMLHDVRNHLQVILGGAEFLLEHRDEPEAAEARILHQIQRNALNGSLLLATYFNTVRIETGRFSQSYQPLDVNALLRRVVQQWETEAQHKQLQLELHFPRRLPSLVGDFAALTLVFSNLLHNAYKFTPPYGRVTLRAAWDDQEVAVSCEDTGCGIVSADLERIFEKTTRAGSPDAPKGTGLGLFIVQTIVAEHAGRVVVHSTPGQGSRFTVYLPRPYAS